MTEKDFEKRRVENITTCVEQLAMIISKSNKGDYNSNDINQAIVNTITEVHDEGMLLALDKSGDNEQD